MGRYLVLTAVGLAFSGLLTASAGSMPSSDTATYLVAYAKGASATDARAAIARLGGAIVLENRALGYAKVSTANGGFLAGVRGSSVLAGAARDRVIATAEPGYRVKDFDVERLSAERQASLGQRGSPTSRRVPRATRLQSIGSGT